MNALIADDLPSDLIRVLQKSGESPSWPAGGKEVAIRWLRRALVDFEALERHIALLQELYDEPFRLPRPRRDCWTAEQLLPPEGPTKFPHAGRLPEATIAEVADRGLEALGDDDLAKLLLNPFALFDLFDVIDDLNPEAWMEVMGDVARSGRSPAPPPIVAAPKPSRVRRLAPPLSLAASVLLGMVLGGLALRNIGGPSKVASVPENGNPFEQHGAWPDRPARWESIWEANYRKSSPPAQNVDRLYRASDAKVKAFIDGLRAKKLDDFEILSELKRAFGTDGAK